MKTLWTLGLSVALLAGCNQNTQGGGGGNASTAQPSVQATRDRLGDAYVQAARTHADVVRGDFSGANDAIKQMRGELSQAKRSAQLDNQARINDLDQEAIRVQRAIAQRSLNGYQSTERLVRDTEALLTAWAAPGGGAGTGAQPAGNGGGGGPTSPMEGATPYAPAQGDNTGAP